MWRGGGKGKEWKGVQRKGGEGEKRKGGSREDVLRKRKGEEEGRRIGGGQGRA